MDPITLKVSWNVCLPNRLDIAYACPVHCPSQPQYTVTTQSRKECKELYDNVVQQYYDVLGLQLSEIEPYDWFNYPQDMYNMMDRTRRYIIDTYFCYFLSAKNIWNDSKFRETHLRNCCSKDLDIPFQFRIRKFNVAAFDVSTPLLWDTMLNLYHKYEVVSCHGYPINESPCLAHALLAACRLTELNPTVRAACRLTERNPTDPPMPRLNVKTWRLYALLVHSLKLYLAQTLQYWCPETTPMYKAILNSDVVTDFHLRMFCCILNIGCFTAIGKNDIWPPRIPPRAVIFTGPDVLASPFAVFESNYQDIVHQAITDTPATIAILVDPGGPRRPSGAKVDAPLYGKGYVAHALHDHNLHNLPFFYITPEEIDHLYSSKDQDPHAILRLCATSFPHLYAEDHAILRRKTNIFNDIAQVVLPSPDDILHKFQVQADPRNTLVLYKNLFDHLHGPRTLTSLRPAKLRKFLQEYDKYFFNERGTRPMIQSIDPRTLKVLEQAWITLHALEEEREYERGIKCYLCYELCYEFLYKCTNYRCAGTAHSKCLQDYLTSKRNPVFLECPYCKIGDVSWPIEVKIGSQSQPLQGCPSDQTPQSVLSVSSLTTPVVVDLTNDSDNEAPDVMAPNVAASDVVNTADAADSASIWSDIALVPFPEWSCGLPALRDWEGAWSSPSNHLYPGCILTHFHQMRVFYVLYCQPHIVGTSTLKQICQCFNFTRHPVKTFEKYEREFTEKLQFCYLDNSTRKTLFMLGIPTAATAFRSFLSQYINDSACTFKAMYNAAKIELQSHPNAYLINSSITHNDAIL